jgi:peptidoglycan/xylan/chitin deacetylase (PgdA/CDA1 family)
MTFFRPLLREAKTRLLESYQARKVEVCLSKPIFSFTFDDVPESTRVNALPVLEDAGVAASFYVAAFLGDPSRRCRADDSPASFFTADDVRAVHRAGHQIACHTYSHYSLSQGSARELARDARLNREILGRLLGGVAIEHFAYPYGEVNFGAKKLLQSDYMSMRSTRPGINYGTVDLCLLRAEPIYHSSFSKAEIGELIRRTVSRRGWLIFYTHAVDRVPGDWGCTRDELAWVVEQCRLADGEILTVGEASERVAPGRAC